MSGVDALLPVDDALAAVVRTARAQLEACPRGTRQVNLWDASGYVLASDVCADRDQPPFRKAMMDGYAFRAADVVGDTGILDVIGEVPAGASFDAPVGPNQAVAIMTGAPVPQGADTVHMVEKTRRDGDRVHIFGPVTLGNNIAAQGSNTRRGDVVVKAGTVIESLSAGVLGSVGASELTVYQRPRVAVLTTGNELVPIDQQPGPSQIRDSNRRTLMALLEREWCRVVDAGIVSDDLGAVRAAVREGLKSEVLVLTGGVSAGSYDFVAQALVEEGVEVVFHKIRIKPGKPVLFGTHPGGLVFGLPGNPVSTYVVGVVLLAPAVRVLGRRPEHRTWQLNLPLIGALPGCGARTTYHPGKLERGADDALHVRGMRWRGSADQVHYARADVMIRREANQPAAVEGDVVKVVLPHSLASW